MSTHFVVACDWSWCDATGPASGAIADAEHAAEAAGWHVFATAAYCPEHRGRAAARRQAVMRALGGAGEGGTE